MGNGGWKFVMMSSAREVQAGATADGVGAFELLELEAFVEVPGVGVVIVRRMVKLGACLTIFAFQNIDYDDSIEALGFHQQAR